MRPLKPSSLLILIALALSLSAANGAPASSSSPNPTPRINKQEQSTQEKSETQKQPTPSAVFPLAAATCQPTPTPQKTNSRYNPQGWNDWFWQNFTAFLLVAVAVWAGSIAISTLKAIERQAKIAERTFSELERAWVIVSLKEARISWLNDGFSIVQIFLTKTNWGRSPAQIVGGTIKAAKLPLPLPPEPDYSGGEDLVMNEPIGPADHTPVPEERLAVNGPKEWKEFCYGVGTWFGIYGFVRYRDIIGIHETRFCLKLFPTGHREPPAKGEPVPATAIFDGPEAYNRLT